MIDHVWTVVCSRAVIDRESNNVSLENVLEQLTISTGPKPGGLLPIRIDVMTLWVRSDFNVPATGTGRVTFVSPSGAESELLEFPINLEEHQRFRSRARYQALPLAESGRYSFRVDLRVDGAEEWQTVSVVPLEVNFAPPVEQQDNGEDSGEDADE
jgi:hypothetical protein